MHAFAPAQPEVQLSPIEEATANAVEADFTHLFDTWADRGLPRNVTVPMALITAADEAKKNGVSFTSAVETLQLIWFGTTKPR